jgi:hypothetical protein
MTTTTASITEEIRGLIEALRSAGAEGDATLLESDLWVAGDDLRELLIVRDCAEELACPASDCI